MRYNAWLVERVRIRAGLPSCRQAEAIVDDLVVLLGRVLPADVIDRVVGGIAESPDGPRPNVPVKWRGWSSSLDL